MRSIEDYEDEIYYLRSQNKKFEKVNNELLINMEWLTQNYKCAQEKIQGLSHKLEKEQHKNKDLKKLIKSSGRDLKSLKEISVNLQRKIDASSTIELENKENKINNGHQQNLCRFLKHLKVVIVTSFVHLATNHKP